MALERGTRLGPYQIIAPIGAGGMGEVYKATDTRLERTVAIKVLPAHVASDPERKARFEREAKTVAALSHPHICPVFDVGREGEIDFLVMEYLEGETLADRLRKGALPLDQALRYAIEIADALDKAHRQGVTHRDLKPANIMLTKAGAKLLDFGLAKLKPTGPQSDASTRLDDALTEQGTILGTFQYMAPEQLEGKDADARTDIWAFGCVVYEMVTGQKAFEGKSQASLIHSIMGVEPRAISSLQPMSPPTLDQIIRICLAKDPDERWQSAGDIGRQFKLATATDVVPSAPVRRSSVSPILAGAIGVALIALAGMWFRQPAEPLNSASRMSILFPDGAHPQKGQPLPSLALSPDGQTLVYTASGPDGVGLGGQLWLRRLNEFEPVPVAGTAGARQAFFSPDGQSIGFADSTGIKTIPITLGPSRTVRDGGRVRGATWTINDEIVFAGVENEQRGLWRVPAAGGAPVLIATGDFRYPDALPDGQAVVVTTVNPTAERSSGDLTIAAVSLADGTVTPLFDGGTFARYVPTGHLVYARDGALMARGFDAATLTVGTQSTVIPDLFMDPAVASSSFAFSASGTLVYASSDGTEVERTLVAIDATGVTPVIEERGYYADPRISPDGRRIAVVQKAWKDRIWIIDRERETFGRLSGGVVDDESFPVWSPDGTHVAFSGIASTSRGLYVAPTDGSRTEELLYTSPNGLVFRRPTPTSWSRDGQVLVFTQFHPDTGRDLMTVSLDSGSVQPLLQTPFEEFGGVVSPDGRWIAYQSNQSGQSHVHLSAFPSMTGTKQVSVETGWGGPRRPVWAIDERRLYFRNGQQVMAVDVQADPGGGRSASSRQRDDVPRG